MKGEDLAGCFTGTLQHFAGTLHAGGTAPRLDSERLLDPLSLRELIERFGAANPGGEPRAVVSMWTQWHFAAVIVPSVVATLLGRVHLPVALGRATLALHENGCTAGVVLSPGQLLDPSPAEGRFDELIEDHVAVLIDRLAGPFSVSQKLLWNNAAASLAWTVQQCAALAGVDHPALAEAQAMLTSPHAKGGGRNFLHDTLRPSPLTPLDQCQRRICCLRYLLPGVADCGSYCPLPAQARARRSA